ncbi:MAG: hypothetical protein ACREBW_01660, partial [Candidatus Micrarchaeaceae archaeon]
NHPQAQRSGRHRSKKIMELSEDKAKGHLHKTEQPEPQYDPPHAKDPKETVESRGHQKGYGKNQREEGLSRHTAFGTRARSLSEK